MFWIKRAHQYTIFQTFEWSNERSPNSSCHFWNQKIKVYSNFASLFSVMKDNSFVFFEFKPHLLLTKIDYPSETFGLLSGWVKIHQINDVIFETTQFIFSLNFASLLNVMKYNSSVLFLLKLHMIFTKGAHQSVKFQTFNCSDEIQPSLYFDRLLLLKVYKTSAEKIERSYVL